MSSQSQHQGSTPAILLLGLPASILCGIDLLSFTTSPRFSGIKDLPPGFHFIFTSETSSLSIRDGFWFHVVSPQSAASVPFLAVRIWSEEKGCLMNVEDPESYRKKSTELWDQGLSPYRQSAGKEAAAEARDWEGLTEHVSPQILQRLTQNDAWALTSASCSEQDHDHIPGLNMDETGLEEHELGVLGIDLKRTWREGAVGRERTEAATDCSWALGDVVGRLQGKAGEWGDSILGQMEACFVTVLTLANYSCLEEWKRCLGLVLTCKRAISEHERFFIAFLVLLRRQVERCEDVEGGLFDMSDEGGGLLRRYLKDFKRTIQQTLSGAEGQDLREEMDGLQNTLKKMYGWELSGAFVKRGMLELEDGETVEMELDVDDGGEDGEYVPVIVDAEEL